LSLFQKTQKKPLADELLDEVYGQEHLFGNNSPLSRILGKKQLVSIILWGPPGCGKTTITRILAKSCDHYFESMSAVINGVADLKKIFEQAEQRAQSGVSTVILVDEIHRFNRSQQDVFLPYLEILIGATTENPSFALNDALLSRCKVLILNRLNNEAMESIVKRTEK
jgi:putative ATPase